MKRLLACVLLFAAPLVACGGGEEALPLPEAGAEVSVAPEEASREEDAPRNAAAGCWVTLRTCSVLGSGGVRLPDCSSSNCTWQEHVNHCWGLWYDICS
ncbi:hypothetical protein ACLESO_27610 [Pyxidicoccus sp. 3LG]